MRAHKAIELLEAGALVSPSYEENSEEWNLQRKLLIEYLKTSTKIWCEEALDYPTSHHPAYDDLVMLPYETCCFEYYLGGVAYFVLAFEKDKIKILDEGFQKTIEEDFFDDEQSQSIFFYRVICVHDQKVYDCPIRFAALRNSEKQVLIDAEELAEKEGLTVEQFIKRETRVKIYSSMPGQDVFWVQREGYREEAIEGLTVLVRNTLCLINCENIHTAIIRPSPQLNRKRARNGSPPIFSYHHLRLPRSADVRYEGYKSPGTGETKRLHWVRGHLRRLSSTLTTWVRPCLRGDSRKGFSEKGYRIRLKAERVLPEQLN